MSQLQAVAIPHNRMQETAEIPQVAEPQAEDFRRRCGGGFEVAADGRQTRQDRVGRGECRELAKMLSRGPRGQGRGEPKRNRGSQNENPGEVVTARLSLSWST
jgi:hypothetical protein